MQTECRLSLVESPYKLYEEKLCVGSTAGLHQQTSQDRFRRTHRDGSLYLYYLFIGFSSQVVEEFSQELLVVTTLLHGFIPIDYARSRLRHGVRVTEGCESENEFTYCRATGTTSSYSYLAEKTTPACSFKMANRSVQQ